MARTRAALVTEILRRLSDAAQLVWSTDEIVRYLQIGQRELSLATRAIWDVAYAENLPKGFSYTAAWERAHVRDTDGFFDYGRADHTMAADEDDALVALGMAWSESGNHTSPFEATDGHLSDAGASTAIPGTSEMPASLTEIDRGTWDRRTMTALNLRDLQRNDTRYRITAGEVYGYVWQQDGVRTLRKVRVPSAQAQTFEIDGSWGLLREPEDISGDTASGTWGIPRQIPTMHPMGAEAFGFPRRPYQEGLNVKIEHWRTLRPLDAPDDLCELPDRYTIALRDYALWKCLSRRSAGQDLQMAGLFEQRWLRAVARIRRRVNAVTSDRVNQMGGAPSTLSGPPPVAKLPWNYPQRNR
jgi:hypothetical protein